MHLWLIVQSSDLRPKNSAPPKSGKLRLRNRRQPLTSPLQKNRNNFLARKLSSPKIWLENSDPQTAVTKKWRIFLSVSGLGYSSYEFATNCQSEQVGIITSRFKERKILRSEVQNNPGNELSSHSVLGLIWGTVKWRISLHKVETSWEN